MKKCIIAALSVTY